MPYSYNDRLKESIVNTGTISASRIVNIDVFFNQNETTAYVTFNNLPPLKNVFRNESISVAKKVLKKSLEVSVGSSDECLHLYTKRATTFEGVAFCENKICASIDKINDLVEDKVDGYDCEIFYVPLKNLNRYDRELSSDAIQSGLISRGLSFSLYNGASLAQYTIASITKVSNEIEKLFSPLYTGYKLPGTNIKVQLVREAKIWVIAIMLVPSLMDVKHSQRDLVHNYNPIFNRRYKDSGSIVADTHLDNCALLCHQSSECYSFQFCQGQCSFAGIYTDSATEYHQNCSVYIPKVSDKFIYTGHKIVSETHHTELNLTMDQCAALCDAWKAGNEPCLSFNYCPEGKTESVCSLSKSSAKNPSTRSVVSEKCTNYEYKDAEKLDSNPKMDQVKGTSGEAALGIITLFMMVGLVAGITTPIAYRKIKTFKILDTSFKIDHSLDEE
uniref:Apple domain-containing protein n=1 Tax=Tetranychus urticae TaxID=32264 RepID=T1JTQ3_TETUR